MGDLAPIDIVGALRRQRSVFVCALVVAVAAALGITLATPRTYRAKALVRVSSQSTSALRSLLGNAAAMLGGQSGGSDADLVVMRSDAMTTRILSAAGVNLAPGAPGFSRYRDSIGFAPTASTGIIAFTADSPDPQLAQRLAEGAATVFLEQKRASIQGSATTTRQFLERQLAQTAVQLAAGEKAVSDFLKRAHLSDPKSELLAATKTAETLEARLSTEQAKMAATSAAISAARAGLAAHPQIILVGGRSTLNPEYQRIAGGIADAEASVAGSAAQVKAIAAQLRTARALLAVAPDLGAEYAALSRNATLYGKTYATLYKQVADATVVEESARAASASEAFIVDKALVPQSPVRPSRKLGLAAGVLAGLFLGSVLAIARDLSCAGFRTVAEVAMLSGAPILAVVPYSSPKRDASRRAVGMADSRSGVEA